VDLGCELEEANPGFSDPDDLFRHVTAPMRSAAVGQYLLEWESRMDPVLVQRIRLADGMTATDYELLQHQRTALSKTVQRFFERFDLLLTPTIALPPFPVDMPYPLTEVAGRPVTSPVAWVPFTLVFNLTGNPAISVPAGWTEDGLPIGLQIVGRRHAEAAVLRAAATFEAAHPWVQNRPGL
jgi:Asp-tRNA(Asn)/Glu-tRNA(Gln) amidotransferase A subunit family amidase